MTIILLLSLAFGVVRLASSRHTERMLLENLDIQFVSGAEDMQRTISQIKYAMSELSVMFAADKAFENGTYLINNNIRADMRAVLVDRRQNDFSKFLATAFIVDSAKQGYVYELTGTYTTDVFFNQYYSNEKYSNEFWLSQITKSDTFKMYPAEVFSMAKEAKRVEMKLLPIIYKPQDVSRYAIVVMLDVEEMTEAFGISGMGTESGEVIYVADENSMYATKAGGINDADVDFGYVFRFLDEQNGDIVFLRCVSDHEINAKRADFHGAAVIGFVFFALIALLFGVFVSFRWSKRITAVIEEISKNSSVKTQFENGLHTYEDVYEGVKIIASHDIRTVSEGEHKESILDSMFLKSKMRDVYIGIEDIEEKVDISRSFFMMYLRVNYKSEFEKYIGKDSGKATFFLNQLIEMYLETWGVKATTFQIENNAIVSVFEAYEGFSGEKDIVESIISKLSNESEYAFFTAAVSNIYNGINHIKNVYEILVDLAKYSKPSGETQVLYENEVKRGASRFYFSVEEMGKLSASLQNGTFEEAVHKVDEIIDYNIKKEINSFELYLLCAEIINCAVKLVNRVLHTLPSDINLAEAYRRLERAYTPEEHGEVCVEFLGEVMDHIRQNKREDDYIISYILDYVDNHYAEDIYLNLFADKLKLTGAYISSYFKEKMNVNLSDYINNYRIKKAVELSENPQNKNKDIAVMVGLPNINTFIRLFKKYTGYTPGEYRKKHFGDDYKK